MATAEKPCAAPYLGFVKKNAISLIFGTTLDRCLNWGTFTMVLKLTRLLCTLWLFTLFTHLLYVCYNEALRAVELGAKAVAEASAKAAALSASRSLANMVTHWFLGSEPTVFSTPSAVSFSQALMDATWDRSPSFGGTLGSIVLCFVGR